MGEAFGGAPVGVTGASGYIASHVVRELVSRGVTVHGTVRDPDGPAVAHLKRLSEAGPGRVVLWKADLLRPDGFPEAFAGCSVVIHTASPFVIGAKNPEETLVRPALEGTRNVLGAVTATPSVTRVVLTSSCLAMWGEPTETSAEKPANEASWNETSSVAREPYAFSKTVAEREAWKLAEGKAWSLVTANPGFVMGPSLTKRVDSASIDFLVRLVGGGLRTGIWDFPSAWVDVRDVAAAHVLLAERPELDGRFLLSEGAYMVWEVIGWLQQDFGDRLKLPRLRVPKWLAYLVAPTQGLDWTHVRHHVDQRLHCDASRSRNVLGLRYTPTRQTLRDHVEQLLRDGLVA